MFSLVKAVWFSSPEKSFQTALVSLHQVDCQIKESCFKNCIYGLQRPNFLFTSLKSRFFHYIFPILYIPCGRQKMPGKFGNGCINFRENYLLSDISAQSVSIFLVFFWGIFVKYADRCGSSKNEKWHIIM